MTSPPDVLVTVPARNEAARIEACLRSIVTAVSTARLRGDLRRAAVAVAAHRCRDDTAARARSVLRSASGTATLVWEIDEVMPVGAVRAGLVRRLRPELVERRMRPELVEGRPGAAHLRPEPVEGQNTWLFSTDADSVVPPSWITAGLRAAASSSARMVVGLVDVVGVSPAVRAAHDRLVRVGLHPDGSHDHVYAANLAIDLAAYTAVGGFPAVAVGEEHALLAAVRSVGYPVLRTTRWRVATSGRTRGRARHGLGDLLGRLEKAGIEDLDRPA